MQPARRTNRINAGVPPDYMASNYVLDYRPGHFTSTPRQPPPPGTRDESVLHGEADQLTASTINTTEDMTQSTIKALNVETEPVMSRMEGWMQSLMLEVKKVNVRLDKVEQENASNSHQRVGVHATLPGTYMNPRSLQADFQSVTQQHAVHQQVPLLHRPANPVHVNQRDVAIQIEDDFVYPQPSFANSAQATYHPQYTRYGGWESACPRPMPFEATQQAHWPYYLDVPTQRIPYLDPRRKLRDLPSFSGLPEEWPKFISSYVETTQAFQYSELENLERLEKSLKDKAKEAVSGLLIHPRNVTDAIKALEFRFGRPEMLIKSQIKAIRDIRPILEDDAKGIVDFAMKVRNMVGLFSNAKAEHHMANPTMLEEMVSKLSYPRKLEWAQYSSMIQGYPTVREFAAWLDHAAHLASIIETDVYSSKAARGKKVLLMKTAGEGLDNHLCILCKTNDHETARCSAFVAMNVEERWKNVKRHRVCFCCLQSGHQMSNCEERKQCDKKDCTRFHHDLLHDTRKETSQLFTIVEGTQTEMKAKQEDKPKLISFHHSEDEVIFRVVPIKLFGPKGSVNTFALLDDGSCTTLMEGGLANELGLEGKSDRLQLQWYDNKVTNEEAVVVNCDIQGLGEGCKRWRLKEVRAMKKLDLPRQSLPVARLSNLYPELRNLPVMGYTNAKPRLLIGLNNAHLAAPKNTIECGFEGPLVTATKLGWVLYGPAEGRYESKDKGKAVLFVRASSFQEEQREELDALKRQVGDYFEMENFGVQKVDQKLVSRKEQRALDILEATAVQQGDGHYETALLWRDDEIRLPSNFPMALKRLDNLVNKLARDPVLATQYGEALEQYQAKGYSRKLTKEEAKSYSGRTWYLPHFAVVNPHKKKIRIVFDAAAEYQRTSLNKCLLAGPDLNQPMSTILYRFREYPIGVCADIKEMFCQIRIRPEDKPAQRYLWRNSPHEPVEVFEMQSMIFGSVSSPCTAQFIKNMNARKFDETYPEAVKAIIESHYVDDYVRSFKDEEEADRVSSEVRDIHRAGGFELRNFVSNSPRVGAKLNPPSAKNAESISLEAEGHQEKILGMHWQTNTDEYFFKFQFHRVPVEVMKGDRAPTKRELLSLLMSVFDPHGFLANFMLRLKIMNQNCWSLDLGWDDAIPDVMNETLREWLTCLMDVVEFRIPRCYSPLIWKANEIQLHVFTDASEEAIACVAYWRIETSIGVTLSFICGKTRTAPRKVVSVPRLELQAAVLGARVKQAIEGEHSLKPHRTFMWTDSRTVELWVRSEARQYRPFVAHRIAEILSSTEEVSWKWVPTAMNPADDGTRPQKKLKCDSECRWIKGPEFLIQSESQWPQAQGSTREECEVIEELRKVKVLLAGFPAQVNMVDYTRFSNYKRLLRTVAWLTRAVGAWRTLRHDRGQKQNSHHSGGVKNVRELDANEIVAAEVEVCRQVQAKAFADELESFRSSKPIEKNSPLIALDPMLGEDGLIRCGGRISCAEVLPEQARHPIILPKDHPVTHLILLHAHQLLGHQWRETVICKVREKFWIPQIRRQLEKVIRSCQTCKNKSAKPMQPMMGQLPSTRLLPFLPPFAYSGLDYFGPVMITNGRRTEKRWVALFCCFNTRAVHLELAHDCSTDALILCLRNFMNLRGRPRQIRSDNGTNFIGLDNEIHNVSDFFDWAKIQETFAPPEYGISWKFNTPLDPSAGGVWERLVQSIKRTLKAILHIRAPQEHTLRSFLLEAMNIVNSRPLTHVPVGHEDEPPITPNHFCVGHTNSTQTPTKPEERLGCLRKQWRISQLLKNHFWSRWIKEYLPTLIRREKWHEKAPPLQVGQLVLICDPNESRNEWKRGRITVVHAAKDGQTRKAVIKTKTGELRRPANRLAVLDVKGETFTSVHGGSNVAASNDTIQTDRNASTDQHHDHLDMTDDSQVREAKAKDRT